MSMNVNYNYDDIETISTNVVKILLKGNVSMEDIMHLSGKTKSEIEQISALED